MKLNNVENFAEENNNTCKWQETHQDPYLLGDHRRWQDEYAVHGYQSSQLH